MAKRTKAEMAEQRLAAATLRLNYLFTRYLREPSEDAWMVVQAEAHEYRDIFRGKDTGGSAEAAELGVGLAAPAEDAVLDLKLG